jgi:uncharacterized protein HemY
MSLLIVIVIVIVIQVIVRSLCRVSGREVPWVDVGRRSGQPGHRILF